MVNINLLPWRDYLKRYQEKNFKKMLLLAIGGSLCFLLTLHYLLMIQKAHLQERLLQKQQDEKNLATTQTPTADTLTIAQIIYQHQQYQDYTQHSWLAIQQTENTGVCFNAIVRKAHHVLFTGYAISVLQLTQFLLHWSGMKFFSTIKINQIISEDHGIKFQFDAIENEESNHDGL